MGAMRAALGFLHRKLGRHYLRVLLTLQFQLALLVALGGLTLLHLYQELSWGQFFRMLAVAEGLVLLDNVIQLRATFRLLRPADPWLRGDRHPIAVVAAWRALTGLPLDFLRPRRALATLLSVVPIAVYLWFELDQPGVLSLLVLLAGAEIVLLYGVVLRFFGMELILRPVVEEVARQLPDGAELGKTTVTLKWRLLASLPAINIITGVAVAGLSSTGQATLRDLGVDVLVAIAVAFTLSFELSVLLSRSILTPLRDLQRVTEQVAAGDFTARVPVTGTDETGRLAGSFNEMVQGLQEREQLREAFGAYVDPQLADRVLAEGVALEGEEVEVSILFLDIRAFTAFAERASAREVVARLNDFFETVVPVLARHGGHANKFIGDGLLGVFGAPDRHPDHADRAVAAALEIAAVVRERYAEELQIGIGVNSGPVVAGTVGGGGHIEFTVIGDPVNTAARVEEVTRATGDVVLLTEATRCLLTREHVPLRERPTVELKGKTERVRLWAPAVSGAGDGQAAEAAEAPLPGA